MYEEDNPKMYRMRLKGLRFLRFLNHEISLKDFRAIQKSMRLKSSVPDPGHF
jgi:hypothetical protein